MSTNAERLGEQVRLRRLALDLTQLDVWQRGGPSNTTLTKIEGGELESLTRITARKLDAALLWEPGSARNIWEGGEPALRGTAIKVAEVLDQLEQLGVTDEHLTLVREDIEAERRRSG